MGFKEQSKIDFRRPSTPYAPKGILRCEAELHRTEVKCSKFRNREANRLSNSLIRALLMPTPQTLMQA
jgi:hypothetical protein